jgi:hypothetical protein
MSVLAILLIAVLAGVYVSYPLWARGNVKGHSREMAAARPGPAAGASDVEELEIDEQAGRVEAEDYSPLAQSYTAGTAVSAAADPDDEIERQVRALRQKRSTPQPGQSSSAERQDQRRPTQKK